MGGMEGNVGAVAVLEGGYVGKMTAGEGGTVGVVTAAEDREAILGCGGMRTVCKGQGLEAV